MAKIKLTLWDNTEREFETGVPIVILGANGAGKTRLGAKIEERNDGSFSHESSGKQLVHRISAQKSLAISESLTLKGLEASEKEVFVGSINDASKKNISRFSRNELLPVNRTMKKYKTFLVSSLVLLAIF